ncbi:hypothetical protein [Calothrix sp. NIES-2098]|uniref:hypothetical protein n=1 Tax=Calothrix sp. NIES-2098 TaxID=1954171 RepID=UPI0030D96780
MGDHDSFVCWGDLARVLMALMRDGRFPSQISQSDNCPSLHKKRSRFGERWAIAFHK